MRLRVIDLDGAVIDRPHLTELIEAGEAERVDARDLEQRLRILASRRAFRALGERLWRSGPSRLWGAPVSTPSTTSGDGVLTWPSLADESGSNFLDELAASLSVTSGDQGEMGPDYSIAAIERLASSFKIVGIDVCGDYSRPRLKDPLRAFLSWSDYPDLPTHHSDAAVNNHTEARLVAASREVLQ